MKIVINDWWKRNVFDLPMTLVAVVFWLIVVPLIFWTFGFSTFGFGMVFVFSVIDPIAIYVLERFCTGYDLPHPD